jgi:hypothetical protein
MIFKEYSSSQKNVRIFRPGRPIAFVTGLSYNGPMISGPSLLKRQRTRRVILLLLVIGLGATLAWRFYPRTEPVVTAPLYKDLKLAEAVEMKVRIGSGDFFAGVIERAGVTAQAAARLIADIRPVYDLASIRSGQTLTLFFEGGALRNFIYPLDRDTYLEAERDGLGKFQGRVMAVPYEVRREVARITIENSLYESTETCGEKPRTGCWRMPKREVTRMNGSGQRRNWRLVERPSGR